MKNKNRDNKMIKPKIMIACATYSGSEKYLDAYLEGIKSQTYTEYELVFCDNSADDVYSEKLKKLGFIVLRSSHNINIDIALEQAYNTLREYFLNNQFDAMWIVESDQVPKKNALEELVKVDKMVVGCPYLLNKNNDHVCVHHPTTEQIFSWREFELFSNKKKIVRVWGCGHGAVLVKRKVIDEVKFRIEEKRHASPDTFWYIDLKEKHIPVYCMPKLFSEHLRTLEDYQNIPAGEQVIKLEKTIFVRCKGDYYNSGPAFDKFYIMKNQVKKLPDRVSEQTWAALEQGLLRRVNPIEEKENIEKFNAVMKKKKVSYKRD